MNQEEKQVLLGLLGSTYGQQKMVDQNIVGESKNLARNSENVKHVFEQVLVHNQQPAPVSLPWAPPEIVNATPPPLPPNTVNLPHIVQPGQGTPLQLPTQDFVVEILNKLDTIIELLKKKKNGSKAKKTTARKVPKLDIKDTRPVYSED